MYIKSTCMYICMYCMFVVYAVRVQWEHTCAFMYMYVYMYLSKCMFYVYKYMCVYIYANVYVHMNFDKISTNCLKSTGSMVTNLKNIVSSIQSYSFIKFYFQ